MRALLGLIDRMRGTARHLNLSFSNPCPALVAIGNQVAKEHPATWAPFGNGTLGWVTIAVGEPSRATIEQPYTRIEIWDVPKPEGWQPVADLVRLEACAAAGRALTNPLAVVEQPRAVAEVSWEAGVLAGAAGGVL